MTTEQKREVIRKHCEGRDCFDCALEGRYHCYLNATPEEIDENYQTLVERGSIFEPKNDPVSHPSHYTQGGIECIDAMVAAFGKEAVANFCMCNAFKYIWRSKYKNGAEDIEKAKWYLNKHKELTANE